MPTPLITDALWESVGLRGHASFPKLTPEQWLAIDRRFVRRNVVEGDVLYTPEAPLQGLLYVIKGLLQVRWPQPQGRSTTNLTQLQLLGGYRPLQLQQDPGAAPLALEVTATVAGEVAEMSLEDLRSLAQDPCWKGDQYQKLIEILATHSAVVAGTAWGKLLASQGWLIGAEIEPVKASGSHPQILFSPTQRGQGLYMVGLGSEVRIQRVVDGRTEGDFVLGYGSVFGVGSFWTCGDMPRPSPEREHGATGRARFPAAEVTATLVSGSTVWLLSQKTIRCKTRRRLVGQRWRWLDAFLDNLAEVEAASDTAVTGLKSELDALDLHFTRDRLYPVLQAGQTQLWRVGVPSPAPTGDLEGLSIVVEGEVIGVKTIFPFSPRQLVEPGERAVPMHLYKAPATAGLVELVTEASHTDHWAARIPSRSVFVPGPAVVGALWPEAGSEKKKLPAPAWLKRVDALRTDLRESVVPKELLPAVEAARQHRVVEAQAIRWPGASLVLLQPLQDLPVAQGGVPWIPLIRLLMEQIWSSFNERCLLLNLVTSGKAPARTTTDGVDEVTLVVPDDVAGAVKVLSENRKLLAEHRYSHVFIHLAPAARGLVGLKHVVDGLLYLNSDPRAPMPEGQPYGVPYTYTSLLPVDPTASLGTLYPPNTVRLRLDPSQLNPSNPSMPDELLSRWARAVTGRRVGVALAGGGIWGMAHIPLLKGLHEFGVPVDMVTGASDGAHVAAWYCTLGLEGFKTLLARWNLLLLSGVNTVSFLTLEAFVLWLDHFLKDAHLEALERICVPVGTDVITGSEVPVLTGNVAQAVRQSASLAPLYPTTPGPHRTWLDGAYSCNLPVNPLVQEGASLLIASNVVQPKPGLAPRPPLIPGRAGRVLADLNLFRRPMNTWYGLLTLGYSVGEKALPHATSHFDSAWTGTSFINVMSSATVVKDMASMPQTRQVLLAVRNRWLDLCKPRVDPKG